MRNGGGAHAVFNSQLLLCALLIGVALANLSHLGLGQLRAGVGLTWSSAVVPADVPSIRGIDWQMPPVQAANDLANVLTLDSKAKVVSDLLLGVLPGGVEAANLQNLGVSQLRVALPLATGTALRFGLGAVTPAASGVSPPFHDAVGSVGGGRVSPDVGTITAGRIVAPMTNEALHRVDTVLKQVGHPAGLVVMPVDLDGAVAASVGTALPGPAFIRAFALNERPETSDISLAQGIGQGAESWHEGITPAARAAPIVPGWDEVTLTYDIPTGYTSPMP